MDDDGATVVLDEVEQRVIGSLMEKERTVPGSYPMTGNALRTACNQSTSRDPVMDLTDAEIVAAVDRLKARGFARMVHASSGARAVKYRQVFDEALGLGDDERAVLTVLLLRGPQSPGELKTRSERLHSFADRGEVEVLLADLAGRPVPMVRELDRQPGQQDARWIHLLGPVSLTTAPAAPGARPQVDRDVVIAAGAPARDAKVRATYDDIAGAYAAELIDELDVKPFDRWLLERIASSAGPDPVADVGCGPGHIAFHLAASGADVTGFDLSSEMVAEASRRFPELPFVEADLMALPSPAGGGAWGAITAWYSLVHLAASELRPAIGLLALGLAPGGHLAVAVHVGDEVRHQTELFGRPVDVQFVLHDQAAVLAAFDAAGLVDVEWYRRGPVDGVEVETERLYVLGRRR